MSEDFLDCIAITDDWLRIWTDCIHSSSTDKNRNSQSSWTADCQQTFTELKKRLITAPILADPPQAETFVLVNDASLFGIGAVLSQIQNSQEVGKSLEKYERNYCVTRIERFGLVVKAVEYATASYMEEKF